MKLATFALILPHLLVSPTAAHLRLRNQQRQLQECEGSDPETCGCDSVLQNDYRGDIAVTETGRTCQKWTEQSPHSHSRTVANYPDKGLGAHNYCRNPDGEPGGAWCYTTDPGKRWDYCDVPSCTAPTTTTTTTTTSATTTTTTVFSTTSSTQLPTCKTPELSYLDELDLRGVTKHATSNCETALSIKKVLMIGIDGLRADVVGMTPLPHIERLKKMGTHSFWADVQSTANAVSGPGWASMFTGVEPSTHRIDGNGDLKDLASQTVFKSAKDAFDLKIAASVSWHPLVNDIINHEDETTLDAHFLASGDETMAAKAKEWILSEEYDFIFVDFDGADYAGHSLGFDGYLESYQNRVIEIDTLIGTLLDAVMETSAGEEWLIVLTSDHGGKGTSHSAYDKYNRKIPFIVASNSPRVDVGFMPLADPGSQMDVLPTIMYFLGGESAIPDGLDGQVFGFKDYTRAPPPPPPGACIPDANNCGCASVKQADYRGNISVTASGKTCQAWGSQTPHSHSRTVENYPNSGLDANYCRNPDGESGAWCYTEDSSTRWELCEVPTCDTA
mmetsp:Transcript_19840/g.28257  ORF Transcript_19840/g.28257 Transcript_19840/m.28257 type:complete len:559 (-) Transcript_19840:81-1757(-)